MGPLGKICCGLIVLVPILLSYVVLYLLIGFDVAYFGSDNRLHYDLAEKLEPLTGDCEVYISPFDFDADCEDPVKLSSTLFLCFPGHLHETFHYGIQASPNGGHPFFFNLDSKSFHKANLVGWPVDRKMRGHGTFLDRERNLIFVISHVGGRAGSIVEIFEIGNLVETLPDLKYKGAMNFHFPLATINDVAVVGKHLFLTQPQSYPIPPHGTKGKKTLKDTFQELREFASLAINTERFARNAFWYCQFDLENLAEDATCAKIHQNFVLANGITVDARSPQKNVLYVVALRRKIVKVFSFPKEIARSELLDRKNVEKRFKLEKIIPSIDSLDNIDFDFEREVIVGSGLPMMYKYLQWTSDSSVAIPGCMIEIDPRRSTARRVFFHNGTKLSTSSCLYSSPRNSLKICGSPFRKGLLVCQ